jgi:NADPH:quinone reductase-like Zn-dependent oxidoreductase
MRAVQYDEFGGVDVLRVAEVPVPAPGPDEVLVQVVARPVTAAGAASCAEAAAGWW